MSRIIEVPDWCEIGTYIEWYAPVITGFEWTRERILSYGYDGFFHQSHNCPVYYTKFSEFGRTVRLPEKKNENKNLNTGWSYYEYI